MRHYLWAVALVLAGCAKVDPLGSFCDLQDEADSGIGRVVRFEAMLMDGGEESPPMVVDLHCSIGIPADLSDAPQALQDAFDAPGRFNKFAVVSGRMGRGPAGGAWLHVANASRIRIKPRMSESDEEAFFEKMVLKRNMFVRSQPRHAGDGS